MFLFTVNRSKELDGFVLAMTIVLKDFKRMMLDCQDVPTSSRQRSAFAFNCLDKLPELRCKLADQEQHLWTWLAGLTVGGIGRVETVCGNILKLLNDKEDKDVDEDSETSHAVEDSVKTEVEQSGMTGANKTVILSQGRQCRVGEPQGSSVLEYLTSAWWNEKHGRIGSWSFYESCRSGYKNRER